MPTEPNPSNALTSAALETMTPELLIEIILQQQQAIAELRSEIDRLKGQRDSDSKTSSKPPSTDLLNRFYLDQVEPAILDAERLPVVDQTGCTRLGCIQVPGVAAEAISQIEEPTIVL